MKQKHPIKQVFFIFFIFIETICCAQKNEVIIKKLIDGYESAIFSNKDSAYFYITKASKLALGQHDDFQYARCLYKTGYYYFISKKFNEAEKYFYKTIPYSIKSNNQIILAKAYYQIGYIESDKCNFNKSLIFFLKSLDVSNKNNLIIDKCNALNSLGILYVAQKDTIKALEYYKENEKIALENNLKENLLFNYNCLAVLLRKSNKEEAINNYNKAINIAEELKNKEEEFNILINLSDIFLSFKEYKRFTKALVYLNNARQIAIELNNEDELFFVNYNLGGYYTKVKKFDEALLYYHKALKFSRNISKDQMSNLYEAFSDLFVKRCEFNEAYKYLVKHDELKDSIFSVAKNKAFNEIQTKYEVEKKNLKIDILTKEKEIEAVRKKQILYIGLVLLIPLIGLLFFYKHRIKTQRIIREKENKIHQQEVVRLEQEQELKRVRGVVEGQDQERNRVAKEIHDGVGGTLAGIKLQLAQVNSIIKSDDVSMIVNQLSNAFNDLRSISHNLSLNYLTDKNLTSLLQGLQNDYKKRNEFQIEIVIFPENSLNQLSEEIKHQLYRIIQELLANIAKHANAKNVTISITNHDDFLNIMVEDDGCGFNAKANDGIGLKNIRERLASVNGELTIESAIGKGSTIIIDIPNIK